MNLMNRRFAFASLAGAFAAIPGVVKAQLTEQEVRNGADIVSTGDVELNQSASGSQIVDINGTPVNGDGIYQTSTGQVVVNDGRVVATGDVSVNQSASGTQDVYISDVPQRAGQPANSCWPGMVLANPNTGQLFYQRDDCCWYPACAVNCEKRCHGSQCG